MWTLRGFVCYYMKKYHVVNFIKISYRNKTSCPSSTYEPGSFLKKNVNISWPLDSLDWSEVSNAPDIDQAWTAWKVLFPSVINKNAPSKTIYHHWSKLPWMDSKLKDLIKQKHRAWNTYKSFPLSDLRRAFCALRNKVTSALCSAEKQFLLSLHRGSRLPNRCDSVKRFWSYVKRITREVKGSSVPDLEV